MSHSIWAWVGFNVLILVLLAIDLGLFHRKAAVVSTSEAAVWTAVWVILALTFAGGTWYVLGPTPALEFITGYLIEKSLSVDNIFVFVVIFSYFQVPEQYRYRVLFWGIIGALIMRAILIAAGAALIAKFHWIIYVFGAFLIFTGIRLAFAKDEGVEPEKNPALRVLRRLMPISNQYEGQRFVLRRHGQLVATPLLVVLLVVETTDVVFALDSIPAIFAVTRDPFIVYTSNVFAILGLRALYFLLQGVMGMFRFLKYGLSVVLAFIGFKMVIADLYHVPITISLSVVAAILTVSIVLSLLFPERPGGGPAPGQAGR